MRRWLLVVAAVIALLGVPGRVRADAPDYAVPNGRFYTQTAGDKPGGFSVTDETVPFWRTFQDYGGVDALGYPISRRFILEGQPAQAFQKAVFQWRPDLGQVVFVNVFDELTRAGRNDWLREVRLVPKPAPIPDEDKLQFPAIVARRQALLEQAPAMRDRYLSVLDPMSLYGLPTSPVEDLGSVLVVRLQRATLQQWKTDRPWARAGEVTIANGGDVAKEAGLFPTAAFVLEPPGGLPPGSPPATGPANPTETPKPPPTPTRPPASPTATAPRATSTPAAPAPALASTSGNPPAGAVIIAIDPGHGGSEVGSSAKFDDGVILREKEINLTVALKLATMLREAGFWVVLTRDSDRQVNAERRDFNGDGQIDLKDELQARIDVANAAKAQLFVSVHHNGIDRPELNGLEVYTCRDRPFADSNKKLGTLVEENILRTVRAAGYALSSRGQKDCYDPQVQKSYFVIGPVADGRPRATNMPGVIGEAMFLTNPADAAALRDDKVLTAEARGYLDAIKKYFGR